nr:DNA-3-methyladenine glycosylase [Rhizobium halophytocola]
MTPIRSSADVARGLDALILRDPRLQPISRLTGPLPLRLAEPGFAGLAHIVVSQMVSRASADAIWRRLVAATGTPPTAAGFAGLPDEQIASIGLSGAKIRTLRHLAARDAAGDIDLLAIAALPADEALAELVALPGIGPWTAEVYLMFCGGHPDIFPAGDLALRVAVQLAFGLPERPDIAAVREIALCWQPWRAVAARLFWAFYALNTGREATPGANLSQA